ncbi:Uncharacterised protein [uncultured archaeon]|nr:Uncharacterised protein [uncultured archaeon]
MAGAPRFDARKRASLSGRLGAGEITVTGLCQSNTVTVIMKIIQPILFILLILSESLLSGAPAKNEPQMNADERRFIVPGLYRRGTGSLPVQGTGLRQWGRSSMKGLYFCYREAQERSYVTELVGMAFRINYH